MSDIGKMLQRGMEIAEEVNDGRLPPEIWLSGDLWRPTQFEGAAKYVEINEARIAAIKFITKSKSNPDVEYVQFFVPAP